MVIRIGVVCLVLVVLSLMLWDIIFLLGQLNIPTSRMECIIMYYFFIPKTKQVYLCISVSEIAEDNPTPSKKAKLGTMEEEFSVSEVEKECSNACLLYTSDAADE